MPQSGDSQRHMIGAFPWAMPPFLGTPVVSLLMDFNGKLLQSIAGAQKEWAEFVQRRVKEDVAVSQQLIGCHSLTDMHEVYSNYLRKTFEHYQEQSQKAVQRAQATAEEFTDTAESRAQRARH